MDRDQTRRARRLDGRAGPVQVKKVREPVAHELLRDAHDEVLRLVAKVAHNAVLVLGHVGGGAHEAGRARAGHPRRERRQPGVLKRLVRHLERQPLPRVRRQRLARRDVEEGRVEGVRVGLQEVRPFARQDVLPPAAVGVIEGARVEAVRLGEGILQMVSVT